LVCWYIDVGGLGIWKVLERHAACGCQGGRRECLLETRSLGVIFLELGILGRLATPDSVVHVLSFDTLGMYSTFNYPIQRCTRRPYTGRTFISDFQPRQASIERRCCTSITWPSHHRDQRTRSPPGFHLPGTRLQAYPLPFRFPFHREALPG